jgi:hypothetical protein
MSFHIYMVVQFLILPNTINLISYPLFFDKQIQG